MVLISDKKYACEACIKGHRSSACKHTDRPLFEIKRKGRPVTQCEHCRELRKTKQVHVKCLCEAKQSTADVDPVPGSRKKGNLTKVLASAAFPDGLPEALGAAVAPRASSDVSSDSEHTSYVSPDTHCGCKDDEDCHCYTLKHPVRNRRKSLDAGPSSLATAAGAREIHTSRTTSSLYVLHPILPKPPQQSHDTREPLPAPRPHGHRSHHASTFFSPYSRAYEDHFYLPDERDLISTGSTSTASPVFDPTAFAIPLESFQPNLLSQAPSEDWSEVGGLDSNMNPFCGCGDACSCAGCVIHRGSAAWFNRGAECANPGSCTACLTCSFPPELPPAAPTPPTTPQSGIPVQFEPLDEWIRSIPLFTPTADAIYQPQEDASEYPSYTDSFVPKIMEPNPVVLDVAGSRPTSACCAGSCQCAPAQCTSPVGCCGCCNGCQCNEHDHTNDAAFGDQRGMLSYTFSGERTPCCTWSEERKPLSATGMLGPSISRLAAPSSSGSRSRGSSISSHSSLMSTDTRSQPRPILPKASSSSPNLPSFTRSSPCCPRPDDVAFIPASSPSGSSPERQDFKYEPTHASRMFF